MLVDIEEATLVNERLMKVECMERVSIIYEDVQSKGLKDNVFVGNKVINVFGKCGNIERAESIFFGMTSRTVISWTTMLSAYVDRGEAEVALQFYSKMRLDECIPNEWTFTILLQACCTLADKEDVLVVGGLKMKLLALEIGRGLHSEARRSGMDLDSCVGSALVSMYGKCGSVSEAENVFLCLPERDISTWNAMLSAYLDKDSGEQVLYLYGAMQGYGVSPDERTSVTALQACCELTSKEEAVYIDGSSTKKKPLDIGRALHADAQSRGFGADAFVCSALVSTYGKCGSLADGEAVFSDLAHPDVVAWTAMLSAYAEQGRMQKALELFRQMQEEGVIADDATLVCVIQACSEAGTLGVCRQIHFDILSTRQDRSLLLSTAFVRAYGNCSSMVDALAVFDGLPEPDVVAWSALISGYARGGNYARSFQVYDRMKLSDIEPNRVTFLSLLTACGHGGRVEKGVEMFESMTTDYALAPKAEHFVTIVDLLARVGDLERAEEVLSRMPMQPDLALWLCLLAACRKHGNVELGKRVFDRAVSMQPDKAAAYVMMSNIYNDAGVFWDAAGKDGCVEKGRSEPAIEHREERLSFIY
jgi:pentatricopeptide repeat protein